MHSNNIREYFTGFIEAINDDGLQLRITSSGGEEATAFLPLNRIPEAERSRIHLFAPIRVDILDSKDSKWKIQIFDL